MLKVHREDSLLHFPAQEYSCFVLLLYFFRISFVLQKQQEYEGQEYWGQECEEQGYWEQEYEEQGYWEQEYWEQEYWEQEYWGQEYWGQGYWGQGYEKCTANWKPRVAADLVSAAGR